MKKDTIYFLNVDIDIHHSSSIDNLLSHLEKTMIVIHKEEKIASLETKKSFNNADDCIKHIYKQIKILPKHLMDVWIECESKDISVGFKCDKDKYEQNYGFTAEILSKLAEIGANLRICIYHE